MLNNCSVSGHDYGNRFIGILLIFHVKDGDDLVICISKTHSECVLSAWRTQSNYFSSYFLVTMISNPVIVYCYTSHVPRLLTIEPAWITHQNNEMKFTIYQISNLCFVGQWPIYSVALNLCSIKISSDFTSDLWWAPVMAGLRADWRRNPGVISWDCMLDCIGYVRGWLDGRLILTSY